MSNHEAIINRAGVDQLRAERRQRAEQEFQQATTIVGNSTYGDIYRVDPESASPSRRRLADTICTCGESIQERKFVIDPRTGSARHYDCSGIASHADPQGELFS